jgi:hypothetical protein
MVQPPDPGSKHPARDVHGFSVPLATPMAAAAAAASSSSSCCSTSSAMGDGAAQHGAAQQLLHRSAQWQRALRRASTVRAHPPPLFGSTHRPVCRRSDLMCATFNAGARGRSSLTTGAAAVAVVGRGGWRGRGGRGSRAEGAAAGAAAPVQAGHPVAAPRPGLVRRLRGSREAAGRGGGGGRAASLGVPREAGRGVGRGDVVWRRRRGAVRHHFCSGGYPRRSPGV